MAEIGISELPVTGTYTVLAMDHPGTDVGEYTIAFLSGVSPVPDIEIDTSVFALHGNYPNPFNPATTIRFDLPVQQRVRLTIYAIDGRPVRTLVNEQLGSGRHEVVWNGKSDAGLQVASGSYLCDLVAGPHRASWRMMLVK